MQQEMLTAEFSFSKNDFGTLSRIFTEDCTYQKWRDDHRDYQFRAPAWSIYSFIEFCSDDFEFKNQTYMSGLEWRASNWSSMLKTPKPLYYFQYIILVYHVNGTQIHQLHFCHTIKPIIYPTYISRQEVWSSPRWQLIWLLNFSYFRLLQIQCRAVNSNP